MNLSQIIEALPLQVYVRRGELVIHFSTPADLIGRLSETSAALSDLDRQTDTSRSDGKADRGGRRGTSRSLLTGGGRSEVDPEGSTTDPDQPRPLRMSSLIKEAILYAHQSSPNSSGPRLERRGQITDRDIDILDAVLRYRFCSAAAVGPPRRWQ